MNAAVKREILRKARAEARRIQAEGGEESTNFYLNLLADQYRREPTPELAERIAALRKNRAK